MKALVVHDSFFGNTEQVARAIGTALDSFSSVTVLRVGEVKPEHLEGIDILFVGSPTRAFRPSPAIQAWLKSLPTNSLRGIQVAAFDTRIAQSDTDSRILPVMIKLFGYAAEPINAKLVKKGGIEALLPEGFYVNGTEGPLKNGELERANRWARQMKLAVSTS